LTSSEGSGKSIRALNCWVNLENTVKHGTLEIASLTVFVHKHCVCIQFKHGSRHNVLCASSLHPFQTQAGIVTAQFNREGPIMRKNTAVLGIVALMALTGALAQDNRIDTIRPDAPALAQYGQRDIGVKTLQFTNPNQLDILKAKPGEPIPTYNRPLTVEVWYPAKLQATQEPKGEYRALTRDGKTEVTLYGRAVRDAAPDDGCAVPVGDHLAWLSGEPFFAQSPG
jgi:hypothetical protein